MAWAISAPRIHSEGNEWVMMEKAFGETAPAYLQEVGYTLRKGQAAAQVRAIIVPRSPSRRSSFPRWCTAIPSYRMNAVSHSTNKSALGFATTYLVAAEPSEATLGESRKRYFSFSPAGTTLDQSTERLNALTLMSFEDSSLEKGSRCLGQSSVGWTS